MIIDCLLLIKECVSAFAGMTILLIIVKDSPYSAALGAGSSAMVDSIVPSVLVGKFGALAQDEIELNRVVGDFV